MTLSAGCAGWMTSSAAARCCIWSARSCGTCWACSTSATTTDTLGRRLHATAGELMRVAGWLSLDSGHHPQAQRYWVAALHAAHAAGDRALGANVIGFMSAQAIDLGQIRESVTLADTARAGYPGVTPRVAGICDLRAAEACAQDRSVTECRRALDSASLILGGAGLVLLVR